MTKEKSVTMKDVAREAGVALGTVSRVINGIPVGESYRLRVEEAIERLHYRVNNYAQGLRGDKTHIIEVILPNLHNPFFASLADCLSKELARRSYRMMLYVTQSDSNLEQSYAFMSEQQMADGIICLTYNPKLRVPERIPTVSIDRALGAGIACVASDNYGGGRLAAQKLAENGCRSLAFLRTGSSLPNETDKRGDGFVRACEDMGLPCQCEDLRDDNPYDVFEAFFCEHMHDGRLDFDGMFCATDLLAHRVRQSLSRMGVRVPQDVQIIGYDGARCFGDRELYCSTIVQLVEEMARTCVSLVLEQPPRGRPQPSLLPVSYAYGGTTRG